MGSYRAIGVMSGSSLDGLDIAYFEITDNGDEPWAYKTLVAECVPMPAKWKLRLEKLVLQNAVTYIKTHTFFGHFLGEEVKAFIDRHNIAGELDFIASHGQTIFHQPENLFTSQIGDGSAIAAKTGFPVICDFRGSDVALGGQGTPIAPAANRYFFPEYKYFLNLGGIANIAVKKPDGNFVAFDIVPVNLILNKLANKMGLDFDKDGEKAATGKVDDELMKELCASWYYDKDYPKSLSGGWVSKVMVPVLNRMRIPLENKLRTVVELIGIQIAASLKAIEQKEGITFSSADEILVTGGGAFNKFLMERIQANIELKVNVPDKETVEFKEALLVALMGVLRVTDRHNCFSSVTGASADSIGGTIYQGHLKHIKSSL